MTLNRESITTSFVCWLAFRNGVATGAGRQAAAREVAIAFGVAACSRTYRENFPGYTFPRCMSSQMAGDS
ncbi:hypothetical protein Aeq9CBH6_01260 [Adlercreutzia equolifaciens]|nr:hypothetical protein Aeq9CBH6_01260 [Adlercreutzia equolifaciens]